MGLDASIYGNVGRGVRSVADYDKDRAELAAQGQAKEINALALLTGRQKYDETARANQEQEALRSLLGDPSFDRHSPDATARLYRTAPGAAAGVVKGWQQQDKAQADLDEQLLKTANDAAKLHRSQLDMVTDPKSYAAWLDAGYKDPVLGKIMARSGDLQSKLQAIPQDPVEFRRLLLKQAAGLEKFAEITKPKIETRNTGGTTDTLAIDPLTGQVRVANSVTNTQSPDNIASNARIAADAAAGRAVQMRGQDKADERAREANSAAVSKPFEVTGPDGLPILVRQDKKGNITPVEGYGPKTGAAKPLNDTQAKALLFGSRMRDADKTLVDLAAKGAELPSLTKRAANAIPLVGGALSMGANAFASAEQQQVEQAQRDFINAVLRRESGAAIAESEFDNARKQYFPEVGDSAAVKKQKATNRRLATEGLLAEVPEGRRNSIGGGKEPIAKSPNQSGDSDPLGIRK